jgi:redox-sensitive bicupin YhaK (pirin superfamily)
VQLEGATVQVVVGTAFGAVSPIATRSPTLALVFDFEAASGKAVDLPALASERALYAVDHPFEIDGEKIDEFTMVVLPTGATPKLAAPRGGRVALVGGEPLGHRFISWNFVSSRRERILAAEADWEAQRFARIPGETEFIPLPTRHP